MDKFRELADRLRAIYKVDGSIYQGIVKSVDGILCTVTMGGIDIPNVRLRASEIDDDSQMLVMPKIGSAVIVGSLSGDLSDLVVLQVDKVESISVNGGKLGGLIKINELINKLNAIENDINTLKQVFSTAWVTVPQDGGAALKAASAAWASNTLTVTEVQDIEDDKITH